MEELAKEGPFDLLLTDTSLFQSLTAAIQCGKGKRVLQIDENSFFGGPQAGSHKSTTTTTENGDSNVCFIYDPSPIVFYARGPLADLLLSLQLTEYLDFMAITHQYIWPSQSVLIPLPFSKEQVMLEPALNLMEKRKLAKLLSIASQLKTDTDGHFTLYELFKREQLSEESRVFQLIAYAACRCESLQDVKRLTVQSAIKVLESLKSSVNHLSPVSAQSPFVIPLWGSSELSQSACRKAAVSGCIQILGVQEQDIAQSLDAAKIVKRNDQNVSQSRMAVLLDRPVLGITGTALITIPPSCDLNPRPDSSCINILQLTSESKTCPIGTWLLHLWSQDARDNFDDIIRLFQPCNILWSSNFTSTTSLPHYTAENNPSPYQPLLPASFDSEQHFITSLLDFNNQE